MSKSKSRVRATRRWDTRRSLTMKHGTKRNEDSYALSPRGICFYPRERDEEIEREKWCSLLTCLLPLRN